MARKNKPPRGGGGSGGKNPGDRHLHVAEPPPRAVSHIGPGGLQVDTLVIPASQPAAPATTPLPEPTPLKAAAQPTTQAELPIVVKRTSASTAVVTVKKTDTAVAKTAEPFRLLVEAMGPDSPNVRVSWCISRATVAELRDKHKVPADSARMLLLVTRELGGLLVEVERRMVPLDSPVEYMRFEQPGRHHIHGFIVWSNLENKSKAHAQLFNLYMDTTAIGYIRSLTDGMTARIAADVPKFNYVAEHTVDVPPEFFAKKPSFKRWPALAKLWWWFVNLWFEKPADQCAFRERALFTVFVKSWFVLLYSVLQMAGRSIYALLLLLIGRRYIKLKAILHPFDYDLGHLIDAPNHRFFEARAYIWLTDSKGHKLDAALIPLRVPLLWGVYATIGYYISKQWEFSGGMFYLTLILAVGAMVAWIVALLLIAGISMAADAWRSSSSENEPSRQAEARRRADAEARAEARAAAAKLEKEEAARTIYYTRLVESGPVCDSAEASTRPPTVWDLPWAQRSLRLVFRHTKAAICKPYAK